MLESRLCPSSSRADLYEAFVLWSFYKCMVESFGSEEALVARLEALQSSPMLAPCCCVRQRLSFQWLQRMTLGVAQYVFVHVALSVLIFVLALAGSTSTVLLLGGLPGLGTDSGGERRHTA